MTTSSSQPWTAHPLILDGVESIRSPFSVRSPYYDGWEMQASAAGSLDIAACTGYARLASQAGLTNPRLILERAAKAFTYTTADLEGAVRMTGMPITVVEDLYRQAPALLLDAARAIPARFRPLRAGNGEESARYLEALAPGRFHVLGARPGFCYAISPGSDPRASALIAANLLSLGMPCVLRASPRDPAAPRLVQALLRAGLDPRFISLVYLDPADPSAQALHFKLVEAASAIWTFGPPAAIDPTLRYRPGPLQAHLDLQGLDLGEAAASPSALADLLQRLDPAELQRRLVMEPQQIDAFAGKTVLRHDAGNCGALACGPLDSRAWSIVHTSLSYPVVCTALRAVAAVDAPTWAGAAAEALASLVVGDPLLPDTQVGYISPKHLDRLESLARQNSPRARLYGGQRLSAHQAAPLLVETTQHLPDFFSQEIPAYVLAVRACGSLEEAVQALNAGGRRLAVSLINLPEDLRGRAVAELHADAVLVDHPTSLVTPTLHEGNDYSLILGQHKLLAV